MKAPVKVEVEGTKCDWCGKEYPPANHPSDLDLYTFPDTRPDAPRPGADLDFCWGCVQRALLAALSARGAPPTPDVEF